MTTLAAIFGIALAAQTPSQTAPIVDPIFLNWSAKIQGAFNPATIPFSLQNLSNRRYLKYGSRTFGINLEWDSSPQNNMIFILPNFGSTEKNRNPPRLGNLIAIYIHNGGYLKYENRSVGVNLGWSSTPVFEWYVIGVSTSGGLITSKQTLGLLNAKAKDFLIYENRSAGINLGWAKSKLPYSEGRRFVKILRDRGQTTMADLLKRLLGW